MTYFDNLPYSKTYLCKGNSNKLLYLLQDQPNLTYYSEYDLTPLSNVITYDFVNYIVYYTHYLKLPNKLILGNFKRLFILFSIYDFNELDSDKKKSLNSLLKKYQSESYEILDLSKFNVKNDELITSQKQRLKITNLQHYTVIDKIEDRLEQYPLTYSNYLPDLENEGLLNLNIINNTNYLISEGIKAIADSKSYEWLISIDSLPSRDLESIFTYSMHGIKYLLDSDKELTYSIFYWYKIFYKLYYNRFNIPIKPFIKLYFTWVYYSTIRYMKGVDRGLIVSRVGRQKRYYFNPSIEAIKVLFSLNSFTA